MSKTIKIGIIGTGGMGGTHANNFKDIPGVELTSCLDINQERSRAFAQKWGIPYPASNLDELLSRVDALSVVTPDRFHFEPALKALQAGKHLLCEKPITVTLKDARTLRRAADKAAKKGVIHMTNFSYRSSQAIWTAAEMVRKGQLGQVRHVQSLYLQSWLSSKGWGHWTAEGWLWRLQTAAGSGGVLADIGCHILDMTTAVAGDVARIRCNLRTFPKVLNNKEVNAYKGRKMDANDTAVIELEFTRGGLGVIQTSRWTTGHANHLVCEVSGTKGALKIDLNKSYHELELCLGKDADKFVWKTKKLKPAMNNYQRFIKAIQTGRQPQPDLVRGAQIQAYLETCLKSAKSGRWEKVLGW